MYSSVVESVVMCGLQAWTIDKARNKKIIAVEADDLKQSCRTECKENKGTK